MADRVKLTFSTYTTKWERWTFTHVVIREMYVEDTKKHLDGTVDNKAGYGTMEAARAQGRRFQSLLDAGHPTHYSTCTSGMDIHLKWQHYDEGPPSDVQQYCQVRFEKLGDSFGEIEEAMTFLRKIGRRIEKRKSGEARKPGYHTFADPSDVVAVLARMRSSVQIRHDEGLESWVATDLKVVPPKRAA